jgi:radical SAM protein with 4Fe4S-binding SPASM domain
MGNKRTNLSQVLPLETPFSMHVFPSYYCNFRCSYCLHSLSAEDLVNRHFKKAFLDLDQYKKAIDDLRDFPDTLKTIIFAGHGEPLLHRNIAEMVRYANKAGVSGRTEIVTNGSLLTKQLADDLIDAELGLLRVSLQGVTDEMYKRVGGIDYRVSDLVDSIAYFHENRTTTKIHIKIINIGLRDEKEEKLFYEMFKPICDEATVEYLIPFINEIDHDSITDDLSKCKLGHTQSMSRICSMPFYMLVLEPNGNIVPCCSSEVPHVYGNISKTSLKEIWNSKNFHDFLCLQLTDLTRNKVCRECCVPRYGLQEGDYLDVARDTLLKKYRSLSAPKEL